MSTVTEVQAGVIKFSVTDTAIAEMADAYMGLTVKGIGDTKGLKIVHDARMVVKNHRVAIEKKRKALKASARLLRTLGTRE